MARSPQTNLSNHWSRAGGRAYQGWTPCLMGLVFLGAGLAIVAVSLDLIPTDPSSFNAPRWVVGFAGGVFAAAGGLLFVGWARSTWHQSRRDRLMAHRPDEPWLADHPWDRRESRDRPYRPVLQGLVFTILLALFMAPFNWWAWGSGKGPLMVKLIVGIFDLVLVLVAWSTFYRLLVALRFGSSRLLYSAFPFFPGEELDARLALPRGLKEAERVVLTLRCIQESFQSDGRSGGSSSRHVTRPLYTDRRELALGSAGAAWYAAILPVHFEIPQDAPGTELTSTAPRYWELEATAQVPGVDWSTVFLVPVYARPA